MFVGAGFKIGKEQLCYTMLRVAYLHLGLNQVVGLSYFILEGCFHSVEGDLALKYSSPFQRPPRIIMCNIVSTCHDITIK